MFTFTEKARTELVEFLSAIGVQDLSERAIESFSNDITDEGFIEVSGRYTASGTPATTKIEWQ